MPAENEQALLVRSVDKALEAWRQGDCVLGEHWFVHRIDKSIPVTAAGRAAVEAGADLAEQEVQGFVVVTQTCDVVRSCADRPFVELCPLVEVDDDRLCEIQRGRRPAYAFVPLLRDRARSCRSRRSLIPISIDRSISRMTLPSSEARRSKCLVLRLARM